MNNPELEQKLHGLGESAIKVLEKRTGLKLSGLSSVEIKKQVKAWEKSKKGLLNA